jgi:RHS repeat-associated protein
LPNGTALDGDRLYNYDASKDNLSQAGEWSLAHDHLGRLVGASASALGNYSATYGYDAFDNNISASVTGTTPPQAIGFTFGALPLNQTPGATPGGSSTGWTYDAAGEATNFAAAPGSSSVTGLAWDGLGRMSQVNAPGLTEVEGYAPSGMRVRRDDSVTANSRRFVYTSGGLLLAEYGPASGGGWQWNRDVIYLGSQAIAEINGAGTHELHFDHLGTPRVITTASGGTAVLEGRQNYGPYGETFPAMNSGYQPLTGYTGHVQTDPTGLIYMRGRFYTPIWHRFVNSDQGADPNTFNQMAYVGGSPVMAVDPSGMVHADKGAIAKDANGYLYICDADGGCDTGSFAGWDGYVEVNGGGSAGGPWSDPGTANPPNTGGGVSGTNGTAPQTPSKDPNCVNGYRPVTAAEGQKIADIASTWVGTKYVSGGTTKAGADCTGSTCSIYGAAGFPYSNVAVGGRFSVGFPKVPEFRAVSGGWQVGDVIHFTHHVAIYDPNAGASSTWASSSPSDNLWTTRDSLGVYGTGKPKYFTGTPNAYRYYVPCE